MSVPGATPGVVLAFPKFGTAEISGWINDPARLGCRVLPVSRRVMACVLSAMRGWSVRRAVFQVPVLMVVVSLL